MQTAYIFNSRVTNEWIVETVFGYIHSQIKNTRWRLQINSLEHIIYRAKYWTWPICNIYIPVMFISWNKINGQ